MTTRTRETGRTAGLRTRTALACSLVALLAAGPAGAQSLEEAMALAYTTNPTLEAQRAQLRAVDELVPQALSGYRPTVSATGSYAWQRRDIRANGRESESTTHPGTLGVEVTQPIYRGGSTGAAVRQAESQVQAQRANLLAVEQEVLLDVATAYLDVVRDQAVLELNRNNEQVLRRQLEAARDRFNVGEITRTDVSLAEARVARAISDRVQAEGRLRASRAAYVSVVGQSPGQLSAPGLRFQLPASLDETMALAQSNNPNVIAAEFAEAAAESSVSRIEGELRPQVGLSAGYSRGWATTTGVDRADTTSLTARVTIPLYEAGLVSARVREAKHTANQRRIQIEGNRRQTTEAGIRAWEALTTARAAIQSREAQVRAAEIALEGVRQEALVGARTTLDTLDAEQELLDARVSLVTAQRDETVAAFQVLAATGQLNSRQLGLPVQYYDFESHYRDVRGQWWGTSIR